MKMKRKKAQNNLYAVVRNRAVLAISVVVVLVGAFLLLRNQGGEPAAYTPINSFQDIHGLAIDPNDSSILYVATHHGLVRGVDDTEWSVVGEYRADFMGFSLHPDGKTFYSSGHPPTGGNIGVAKSTNQGIDWETIALAGQVDFHAMAISHANPNILYGWHGNRLYKSTDGGEEWQTVNASNLSRVFALAPDPREENTLWAATDSGLYASSDGGGTFQGTSFLGSTVTTVAVDPNSPSRIFAWIAGQGLMRSQDGSASWQSIGSGLQVASGDAIGYVTIDPTDPNRLYAATYSASIYKSLDGGNSWQVVIR